MTYTEILVKKRKDWVDALRAMAMIFVIFGHQAQWCNLFFQYTTAIKIPLFFAISGYLFNDRDGNQKEFYKNWFLKLVVPFFCLITIPALLISVRKGIGYLLDTWYGMVSGEIFWFMTCIVVAEVIHFYIRKSGRSVGVISLLCIICFVAGILLGNNNILDFGKVNTSLICQLYFLIGFLIKKYEPFLTRLNLWWGIGLLCVYIIFCFIAPFLFSNYRFFDCHLNHYFSVPYCLVLIVIGCLSLFIVFRRIKKFPKWSTYIGQNTLILYLWSGHAVTVFYLIQRFGVIIPERDLLFSIVETIWCVIACMLVSFFVNRYTPFIVGKRK